MDNFEQSGNRATKIENLAEYFEKENKNIEISNWKGKLISLLEKISIVHVRKHDEISVKALLACFLEKVRQCYIKEKVDSRIFGNQLLAILAEFEPKLPSFLKTAQGENIGKRKPSFIESVNGTLERFYKIEELKNILQNLADGIIVGGSMSYGPFFNIRKSFDATGSSDIDLIIIIDANKLNSSLWNELRNSNIVNQEEKNQFCIRIDKFRSLSEKGEADVFSQKFDIQNTDFAISLHLFKPAIFDKMIGNDFQQHLSANRDEVSVLKDFKAKKFPHKICAQRNFLGERYEYHVPEQRQVDGGVITDLPAYIIKDQHFYPGIYQNLISPGFSVSYDCNGETAKKVMEFKNIMEKRLNQEKLVNPAAQLLKSHIRYEIFSPELLKKYQQ